MAENPDPTMKSETQTREDAMGALLLYLSNLPQFGGGPHGLHVMDTERLVRLGFAIGTRDDYLDFVPPVAIKAHAEAKIEAEKYRQQERMSLDQANITRAMAGGGLIAGRLGGLW